MIAITPEQAAEVAYSLTEFAVGGILIKDPTTLAGFQALGPALVGVANGTQMPTGLEAPVQQLLGELGVDTKTGVLAFLVDGAITQLNATANKTAPSLTVGVLNTLLTQVGNAIIAACALYVRMNPPVAAKTA